MRLSDRIIIGDYLLHPRGRELSVALQMILSRQSEPLLVDLSHGFEPSLASLRIVAYLESATCPIIMHVYLALELHMHCPTA